MRNTILITKPIITRTRIHIISVIRECLVSKMFVADVNYNKSTESSLHDDVSFSDLENVAVSPEDNRIDVVNVEQLSVYDNSSDKGVRTDESRSWTMAKVQVGYDVTRKGERSLVVDGFKFTKSRDGTNNRIFWRCSRRECKATAVTVCDRVEHVRAIHAHEPPLAAEFFGSHEGVSEHCELQEVRFNTNAANVRPRYRRSNVSISEINQEETGFEKDLSNSTNSFRGSSSFVEQKPGLIKLETMSESFKPQSIDPKPVATLNIPNPQQKLNGSVKDQVREFILRNSSQINSYPQQNGVSVAQFLISPGLQGPFLSCNNSSSLVSSTNCAPSSTAFNFNPVHISALSNHGSDSPSDMSSHKSTPGVINMVSSVPRYNSPVVFAKTKSTTTTTADPTTLNQTQIEQIIQMLLKNESTRQRSPSDSEWCSPTPGPGVPQFDLGSNSSTGVPESYQVTSTPPRFVHWKKEKIRESAEINDPLHVDRKRRYEECVYDGVPFDQLVNTATSMESDTRQLCSFLAVFKPTITRKLMGVMQKLSSELCPEQAVAQDVYEKCTAIKTCLETLEKLHSLTSA